jgi:hypothetical protein
MIAVAFVFTASVSALFGKLWAEINHEHDGRKLALFVCSTVAGFVSCGVLIGLALS